MCQCEIVIPLKYLTENEADLCLNYPDNIPREKITKFYNRYFWLENLRKVYGNGSIDIAMSKIKKKNNNNNGKNTTTPSYLDVVKGF